MDRRDSTPGSAPGTRGKIFMNTGYPPAIRNKPYFSFEGRTASLRRVKLTHSLAATREKLLQNFLCIGSSRISAEPLSDQEPGRSMVYSSTQLQILDLPVLELNPLNFHLFFVFDFPPAKRVLSTRSSKSSEIYPIKKVFFSKRVQL